MTADRHKSDLRKQMRQHLAAMSQEQRRELSSAACRRLAGLDLFTNARVVMLYMPLETELDVTPVAIRCFQSHKTVCVPRVDWKRRDMTAVEVSSFDDHVMDVDEHGVRTPRDVSLVLPATIDLVVVPGLAFDDRGFRLGRGGGCYDRFLSRLRPAATSVGICFDLQIIDEVPIDDRDVAVDLVVTDRRVARPDRSRAKR